MIPAKFNTTLKRLREQWVTVHQGNEPLEDAERGWEEGGRKEIEIGIDTEREREKKLFS